MSIIIGATIYPISLRSIASQEASVLLDASPTAIDFGEITVDGVDPLEQPAFVIEASGIIGEPYKDLIARLAIKSRSTEFTLGAEKKVQEILMNGLAEFLANRGVPFNTSVEYNPFDIK